MDKEYAVGLLKEAYENLKDADASAACALLEQALALDYGNEEIKLALKCVNWWLEHSRRIDEIKNPYEKGAFLISLFRQYHVFLGQLSDSVETEQTGGEQCRYAVRYYVYSKALSFLKGLLANPANLHDHGLLLLTGLCYKGIGNYDEALKFLDDAFNIKREDPETLAQLADVNALLARDTHARALFKEAFFINPLKIDLRTLESAFILKLCKNVAALGYQDEALCEWIPVYGCLWKLFNVKRELKQLEAGRLKQSVFSLEAEYDANPARRDKIKPRLLNHYFWLIDYYETTNEDTSHIEDTLLKIKLTDEDIYKLYTQ